MAKRIARRAAVRPKNTSPTKCVVTQGIVTTLALLATGPQLPTWSWETAGTVDRQVVGQLAAKRLAYVDSTNMARITELGRDQLAYWLSKGWVA